MHNCIAHAMHTHACQIRQKERLARSLVTCYDVQFSADASSNVNDLIINLSTNHILINFINCAPLRYNSDGRGMNG